MDLEELREVQSLIILASKQSEKTLQLVLRNLWKKYKSYKLEKDPELKKEFAGLERVQQTQGVYAVLSRLQRILNKKILEEEVEEKEKTYPSFLLANEKTSVRIRELVQDQRVREKLRYIFDNIQNQEFFRRYSKRASERNDSDMDIINTIIRHGITLRIFAFIQNGVIYCCGIFINHDEYERAIKSRIFLKKNFMNERWYPIPQLYFYYILSAGISSVGLRSK